MKLCTSLKSVIIDAYLGFWVLIILPNIKLYYGEVILLFVMFNLFLMWFYFLCISNLYQTICIQPIRWTLSTFHFCSDLKKHTKISNIKDEDDAYIMIYQRNKCRQWLNTSLQFDSWQPNQNSQFYKRACSAKYTHVLTSGVHSVLPWIQRGEIMQGNI